MTSPYVTEAARRAQQIGHQPTELNPAGIYLPPAIEPPESTDTKRLVIGTCLLLGFWGIFGFALCYFLRAL